jgi:hypothetical protein
MWPAGTVLHSLRWTRAGCGRAWRASSCAALPVGHRYRYDAATPNAGHGRSSHPTNRRRRRGSASRSLRGCIRRGNRRRPPQRLRKTTRRRSHAQHRRRTKLAWPHDSPPRPPLSLRPAVRTQFLQSVRPRSATTQPRKGSPPKLGTSWATTPRTRLQDGQSLIGGPITATLSTSTAATAGRPTSWTQEGWRTTRSACSFCVHSARSAFSSAGPTLTVPRPTWSRRRSIAARLRNQAGGADWVAAPEPRTSRWTGHAAWDWPCQPRKRRPSWCPSVSAAAEPARPWAVPPPRPPPADHLQWDRSLYAFNPTCDQAKSSRIPRRRACVPRGARPIRAPEPDAFARLACPQDLWGNCPVCDGGRAGPPYGDRMYPR